VYHHRHRRRRRRHHTRVTHALRLDHKDSVTHSAHGLVASPSSHQESPRRHNRWMTGVHLLAHARLGPPQRAELTGVRTRNDHRSLYRDANVRCHRGPPSRWVHGDYGRSCHLLAAHR